MANTRILYTEEMVGYGHPVKTDTLNRLTDVEHDEDGTHGEITPSGCTVSGVFTAQDNANIVGNTDITGSINSSSGVTFPTLVVSSGTTTATLVVTGGISCTTSGSTFQSVTLSNGQIAFPATAVPSADANTLDDYEEGTWSPNLGSDETFTVQLGDYIKIGRRVFLDCDLKINAINSGSTTRVSGIPFTASSSGVGFYTGSVSYFEALAKNVIFLGCGMNSGGVNVFFVDLAAGAVAVTYQSVIWQNAARVAFHISHDI